MRRQRLIDFIQKGVEGLAQLIETVGPETRDLGVGFARPRIQRSFTKGGKDVLVVETVHHKRIDEGEVKTFQQTIPVEGRHT